MKSLLVEDDRADARLIQVLLKDAAAPDVQIEHVGRLDLARERVGRETFDVVLLDLGLPDSQGLATFTRMQEASGGLPIVVLTGLDDEGFALEVVRAGAEDYLVKGRLSGELLVRTIRYAVERRRAADELRRLNAELEQRVADRTAELRAANLQLQRDISDRQQIEAERARIAEQRQLALDAARMGWWHYDPITRVASWDERYKEIFGVTGYEGLNDEILSQIIHPDDRPGLWARVEAALNSTDPELFAAEYRIIRPDGAPRWIEAHGVASFEGDRGTRRATSLVGTVADITDRKQAEVALRELNESLEARVAERTAEAEDRAWQLRLLAARLTQAERKERERIAKMLHDHLQQLLVAARLNNGGLARVHDAEVKAVASRTDELLGQAIADSRSLTTELSPPILRDAGLAAGLAWLARHTQEQHNLQVELAAVDDIGPTDPDVNLFLFEAARELLFNVVKHAGVTTAHAILDREGGDVRLRVVDYGKGIRPEAGRIGQDTKSGFGLFSIQQRIALLGGRMTIEADAGRGTTITLIVPAGLQAPLAAAEGRSAGPSGRTSS